MKLKDDKLTIFERIRVLNIEYNSFHFWSNHCIGDRHVASGWSLRKIRVLSVYSEKEISSKRTLIPSISQKDSATSLTKLILFNDSLSCSMQRLSFKNDLLNIYDELHETE